MKRSMQNQFQKNKNIFEILSATAKFIRYINRGCPGNALNTLQALSDLLSGWGSRSSALQVGVEFPPPERGPKNNKGDRTPKNVWSPFSVYQRRLSEHAPQRTGAPHSTMLSPQAAPKQTYILSLFRRHRPQRLCRDPKRGVKT